MQDELSNIGIGERIKALRQKEEITQEEFGKKIGSARNTIANYEMGNRNPSNAVITSICREFKVDENWLRAGEGEMFGDRIGQDEIAELVYPLLEGGDNPFSELIIDIMRTYHMLDPKAKKAIDELIGKLVENRKNKQ